MSRQHAQSQQVASEADTYAELAVEALRRARLRITRPRRSVLALLGQSTEALTATDIYESLRKRRIAVDQASVYRTLSLLEEYGLAHKAGNRGGYVRCLRGAGGDGQLHMVCRRCERVLAVDLPLTPVCTTEATAHGFVPESCHVVLRGYCSRCATTG